VNFLQSAIAGRGKCPRGGKAHELAGAEGPHQARDLPGGSIRDPVERSPAPNINLNESPACWLIHCNSLRVTGDE